MLATAFPEVPTSRRIAGTVHARSINRRSSLAVMQQPKRSVTSRSSTF
jgi:hypothetical protein